MPKQDTKLDTNARPAVEDESWPGERTVTSIVLTLKRGDAVLEGGGVALQSLALVPILNWRICSHLTLKK